MKILKYIIALFIIINLFNACDFDKNINVSPNRPKKSDTRFLFLNAEKYTSRYVWNSGYNPWVQIYPQYIGELKNIQFTTFKLQKYSTGYYYTSVLSNLKEIIDLNRNKDKKMEPRVSALGDSNNQIATAMTLKAFYMMHMTDIVGALPYSESLMGEKNFTPKFDSQEEIYNQLFKELNEAYTLFAPSKSFNKEYDILYNGDIAKWMKLNASIRMMMAIKLQTANPTLGKTEFAKAYSDGAIIDNQDNLVYKFLLEGSNENPLYYNMQERQDFSPSSTIIDTLKSFNDPRLSSYASKNSAGKFEGVKFGWYANEAGRYNLTDFSAFHPKYYESQDAPMTIVSASQVLLMATEAANIGWISDNKNDLYKKAIEASFNQHDIDANKVTEYIAGAKVKLDNNAEDIKKIAMQKWIASYMQDGVEAWSDWRRLQTPSLTPGLIGSLTVKNIPYRLMYSNNDSEYNKKNYDLAIKNQGKDDIYTKLWWNK